jgi:tRNA-dihydrouridine synthase A
MPQLYRSDDFVGPRTVEVGDARISSKHNTLDRRFAIAPMMDWTDRHCRFFHRIMSRRARLYTEMLTARAVLHGERDRLLRFDAAEHPVALQLGGSDPAELAAAARIGADYGFDEINLNVGCPSERVQSGAFGACLMREPELVGDCVAAIKARVALPVTVKCRTGVDEQDPEAALGLLAGRVITAGCDALIVHARKAWLKGLSPKQNRDVPPLDYPLVWRLKRARPELTIVINGGIASLDEAEAHLAQVDGVMLGRGAYHSPGLLGDADRRLFGAQGAVSAQEAVAAYLPYVRSELARGTHLAAMTRHMLGLFHGQPGARSWRRVLTVEGAKPGTGIEVIEQGLAAIAAAPEARREAVAA